MSDTVKVEDNFTQEIAERLEEVVVQLGLAVKIMLDRRQPTVADYALAALPGLAFLHSPVSSGFDDERATNLARQAFLIGRTMHAENEKYYH